MRAAIVLALVAIARAAHADPPAALAADGADAAPRRAAYLDAGLDGALVARVGYADAALAARLPGHAVVFAELTIPSGGALDDGALRGGLALDLARRGPWALRARVAPSVAAASNGGGRTIALGTDAALAAGRFGARASAAVELAVAHQWLAHVAPSDWYRANVYPDARAGWYADTATTWRAGGVVTARVGDVELALAAGVDRTGALDFLPQLYATAGAAYLW